MASDQDYSKPIPEQLTLVGRLLRFCLENRLIVALIVLSVIVAGVVFAPFEWNLPWLPRYPVATDAIPDVGENQQIIFTDWPGRSPQDVEDQVTYPLSAALQGVPGVKSIRSTSMFGFSSIAVIFHDFNWLERLVEGKDFYWTRSRVLEKLNSLPPGTLPEGVQPSLGPDATGLGQIFWYTLEGRDSKGRPAGGWDLEQLRSIQDWDVRYALLAAEGVSEVASVGGFVREYQVDVDPDAMRAYGVTLNEVHDAVRASNIDVGARTLEMNGVEYFVRGVGFIQRVDDIADTVVAVRDNVPVLVRHVATVTTGPDIRRGSLDKDGAEATGGVVVARYGSNPLEVIDNVKRKIEQISPGLPTRAVIDESKVSRDELRAFARQHGFEAFEAGALNQPAWVNYLKVTPPAQWPPWAELSRVTIVPFYDRTPLIRETLGTLKAAVGQEVLITFIVVIVMMVHLRSSVLIGGMMPLAILLCFIAMKLFGIDANIVALSGIAIAVGTIVDMGIVLCENMLNHLEEAPPDVGRLEVIHRAASEVGSAILTAVATTVVGFLPVFFLPGASGKLFSPLAFTKTFALAASIVIALTVLPPAAHILLCGRVRGHVGRIVFYGLIAAAGAGLFVYGLFLGSWMVALAGAAVMGFAAYKLTEGRLPDRVRRSSHWAAYVVALLLVGLLLTRDWEPLGPQRGLTRNAIFVGGVLAMLLGGLYLFKRGYVRMLRFFLRHKLFFFSINATMLVLGLMIWLGFGRLARPAIQAVDRVGIDEQTIRTTTFYARANHAFPGLGKEFMPPLDEGSFLWMPVTMDHAGMSEALDVLAKQDQAIRAVAEVQSVVGKIGRVESAIDPAPISMVETVINYKSEYMSDEQGQRLTFRLAREGQPSRTDGAGRQFALDDGGQLIVDARGFPFRQWRPEIRSPDDIWAEIVKAGKLPETTSASKLQPIATRLVMLQTGMRAKMGVKVRGRTLDDVRTAARDIEQMLREVPSIEPATVQADRIIGKPYIQIIPDRNALARYGVPIRSFQDVVEIAVGGRPITTTVEGRQRFPVRVRYPRELRDQPQAIEQILVPGSEGAQVPLMQLAEVQYVPGPMEIKSEGAFLIGYVTFDMQPGQAEVDVVEQARRYLADQMQAGRLILPAGVHYDFSGTYEQEIQSRRTLAWVLPLSLFVIFLLLYLQFREVSTTLLVFFGIILAWSGGFMMLWLYGQSWFLDFSIFDVNMRDLFQVHPINLSVAVWVGFLALFGIAEDDGVIIATYLGQSFRRREPKTVEELRQATVQAGQRRIRPCLMTTATTILALLPVLSSTGRGSDVMVPMAIPSFGGMCVEVMTLFFVPVAYCAIRERRLRRQAGGQAAPRVPDPA